MAWVVWLLVPVALTLLAALASWLRHRPARRPDTAQAMREHAEFLDALARSARRADRSAPPGD